MVNCYSCVILITSVIDGWTPAIFTVISSLPSTMPNPGHQLNQYFLNYVASMLLEVIRGHQENTMNSYITQMREKDLWRTSLGLVSFDRVCLQRNPL